MTDVRSPSTNPLRDARSALRRLDTLEGVPFGTLANPDELSILHEKLPTNGPRSITSWHSDVVERILGICTNNIPDRDLPFAEVKIIPIVSPASNPRSYANWPVPKEDTKLCSLNYNDLLEQGFYESVLFHKVSSVLFVPVVWGKKVAAERTIEDYENMYMVNSFLWIPDSDFLSKLKQDYDTIRQEMMNFAVSLPTSPPDELLSPPLNAGLYLKPRTGGGQDATSASNFSFNGKTYKLKKKTWFYPKRYTYDVMQHVFFE